MAAVVIWNEVSRRTSSLTSCDETQGIVPSQNSRLSLLGVAPDSNDARYLSLFTLHFFGMSPIHSTPLGFMGTLGLSPLVTASWIAEERCRSNKSICLSIELMEREMLPQRSSRWRTIRRCSSCEGTGRRMRSISGTRRCLTVVLTVRSLILLNGNSRQ